MTFGRRIIPQSQSRTSENQPSWYTKKALTKSISKPAGKYAIRHFLAAVYLASRCKQQRKPTTRKRYYDADGDTESNALNGQQLRAHQTVAHGQSESELQCTEIEHLQTRIIESYAKVRNMTKRLRTRERQLERLQEDAEKVRGEKTELAKFSILYQEKLASAESTIAQL